MLKCELYYGFVVIALHNVEDIRHSVGRIPDLGRFSLTTLAKSHRAPVFLWLSAMDIAGRSSTDFQAGNRRAVASVRHCRGNILQLQK